MKEDQDYIKDIAEMRSMMERSSRFLSISGLAGLTAGIYALAGAIIAYTLFDFNPGALTYDIKAYPNLPQLIILATVVLVLATGTAAMLSYRKANKRGESIWNNTSRRVLVNMAVPLVTGGVFILILLAKGIIGLAAPCMLIFYGLALFNASKFMYEEMRTLGLIQTALGLISTYFVEYGLIFWAAGFGVVNIIYGIYLHYRYER